MGEKASETLVFTRVTATCRNVSVKTLDLGGAWEEIRNQLDCVAAVLIASSGVHLQ